MLILHPLSCSSSASSVAATTDAGASEEEDSLPGSGVWSSVKEGLGSSDVAIDGLGAEVNTTSGQLNGTLKADDGTSFLGRRSA